MVVFGGAAGVGFVDEAAREGFGAEFEDDVGLVGPKFGEDGVDLVFFG